MGSQNTSDIKARSFSEGMNKDVADMYLSDKSWTHAVNAINNSHNGEIGVLGNEQANYFATSAPFVIIGAIYKKDGQWILFSTNNTQSEIGIFNENNEQYSQVVRDNCLGFKQTNLITGSAKENYDCTWSVYWQDNLNPDRVLNLDRIPYLTTGNNLSPDTDCFVPEYTANLDCDALRLHPLVTQPCVSIKKAQGAGQLNNGSYMACIAYSDNGIRLTDYSMPSLPQSLWDHTGIGGALEINITNVDPNFHEYELVIVAIVNQQTIAKKIGYYSTRQTTVALDLFNQSLETINLNALPLRNEIYEKSEKMHDLGGYLIRTGVTSQEQINYQPLANNITAKWVAVEYPSDYYYHGGNITGYMRDEVYAFFIRWVYNTGARTASFHIPGRPKKTSDGTLLGINTADVIEPSETQKWQVYDTATSGAASGTLPDGGLVKMRGDMAYWESTERYPDDQPEVWDTLCGKHIRHHKMPSNETCHIHTNSKIWILGVEFYNIEHPKDLSGNPIKEIIGYEILRGSREGNRSIVAKGVFNNMWEYEMINNGAGGKKGLYQNYPYNDLNRDQFLTTDVLTLDSGSGRNDEINGPGNDGNMHTLTGWYQTAPNTYKTDYFSFHSPETNFVRPYLGTNHIKIYTEERGLMLGNYEHPYHHPKHKFITEISFIIANVVGAGIALLNSVGKTTITAGSYVGPTMVAGNMPSAPFPVWSGQRTAGSATSFSDLIVEETYAVTSGIGVADSISAVAGVVLLAANFGYYMGEGVDQTLSLIYKIIPYRQYALQFNSRAFYDFYAPVTGATAASALSAKPCFRRNIKPGGARYIGSGIQDFDATYRINNLNRNKFLAVNTFLPIPVPAGNDNTRVRVRDVSGIDRSKPFTNIMRNTSTYYGAIKVAYQNQYGQLDSIMQMPIGSCVHSTDTTPYLKFSSGVLFGGDIYINRYTEKNPYYFFNTWLMGEPNGTDFDYRNYINGPIPRYWMDTNPYDISDLDITFDKARLKKGKNPFDLKTPSDFHRLDRPSGFKKGAFAVKNSYMYLFYNGVRIFFTESELNMAYRDYGEKDTEKFYDVYGNSFSDLSTMFRSDLITIPVYYKYDLSLSTSKLFNNFASWGSILPRDYDPQLYSTCFQYYPKRAVYSLQQQSGLKRDNWRNYLPLNYKDFSSKITTIKAMNNQGAIVLFEDFEPVQFTGVDQLETKGGVKFTIGDGGLFQQNMQSILNADDALEYGSCTSYRSAINTPHGMFYISQRTGKIFQYAGSGVDEISRNGLKFWFSENLPYNLLKYAPNYKFVDNPVIGIGCQSIYDPQYELIYFTKKDYKPLRNDIYYDDPSGVPYIICGENEAGPLKCPVKFTNPEYFENCSWTVSYDPKTKMWVSFHSWAPDLMIPAYKHFYTTKGGGLWKHNSTYTKYNEYYGVSYPWEVEVPIINMDSITTLRSVEYYMEALQYTPNGKDYHHILDANFDTAVLYNSEQISGILKLHIKAKNNPGQLIQYPMINLNNIDILASKEENKYRFNTFWDITNDRGEFTINRPEMWNTFNNGYTKAINPLYVDYTKPSLERKKFRHYGNRLILRNTYSTDYKMLLRISAIKNLKSPR
jgi:hypothetical protein